MRNHSHRPLFRTFALLIVALALSSTDLKAQQVILPAEGAILNRLHVQFRWEASPSAVGRYRLEIVEDDGSPDPFAGTPHLLTRRQSVDEPRTVVTHGLEFGQAYAWRVVTRVATPSSGPRSRPAVTDVTGPVRRFRTKTVVIDDLDNSAVPSIDLVYSAGAGVLQPGLTLWGIARRGSAKGHILAVDDTGKLVLHLTTRNDSSFSDIRLLEDGRLFWNDRTPRDDVQTGETSCRSAMVATLDALVTWQSETSYCSVDVPPPISSVGVHHEVFPMPIDAPRGANFLTLEYDNRFISYTDIHDGTFYPNLHWQGDVVNEIDRHTLEVVRSWSTFDGISLDDHLPLDHDSGNGGPGDDWNHANAAIYDALHDRVWVSLREQSRLVGIDWSSNPPQAEIHFGDNSIVGSALYSGPYPSGDVDFGDNFFSFQHAPQLLPDGHMLVYNNGNYIEPYDPNDLSDRHTTAVEIAFDNPAAPTAATIVDELPLLQADLMMSAYASFVGDADRLANGNTLINDGPGSNLMELDPAGNALWFLDAGPPFDAPAGVLIYRVERVPALIVDTPGDTDGDWDIDMADWARLQVAYASAPVPLLFPDSLCDHDGDGELGPGDVSAFTYWLTGPGR